MIQSSLKKLTLLALAAYLFAAAIPSAHATLSCTSWKSGSAFGDDVYNCDLKTGTTGGTYNNSYYCINKTYNGYCTLSYSGGEAYKGSCSIILKCSNGQTYYCDVKDWDGKETIKCSYLPYGCKEIYVCGPKTTTPVPEPATVIAGIALLVPFGISTFRILRKQRSSSAL